ncbi:MAG: HNH endonuclease [Elusimicrobia bacterium]|nr:HNH endonuclease [Elusimicrobiota bacterium]
MVQFSFTAAESVLLGVERAKELLRHKYPFARLEDIFAEALKALLERIDPDRRHPPARAAAIPAQAPKTRNIPAAVKAEVWRRDAGACAFVGPAGRCGTRAFLEYDHVVPWALGGTPDDPGNIRLLCRAHNRCEARRVLG